MQILHICSDYFGTSLYRKLFENLSQKNIDSTIYVPKYHQDIDGSNVFTAPIEYNIFDRILFFPKENIGKKDILEQIDLSKIDVIHSHNLFSGGYIAYQLNKTRRIPYIVAIRNTDLNIFFHYMIHLRKLGVSIMRGANKIVFISPAYKETVICKYIPKEFQKEIESKSIVIPNGIDDFFLSNLYNRPLIKWDNVLIKLICIGSLNKNKNIDTTIKVCEYLIQNGYDVKLTLIGEIKDKKYNDLAEKYDFITYHPTTNKERILE